MLFFNSTSLFSQNIFDDLRSLEKRGDLYYSRLSYAKAADFYTLALRKRRNATNYELNNKAAQLYRKIGRYEEARKCFNNIILSGHALSKKDSILFFNILKSVNDTRADTIFTSVYSRKVLNNLFRDTLYYNLYELPINTVKSEYCPLYFQNGLLYVSDEESSSLIKNYNAINNGAFSRLYYSQKLDTNWSTSEKMDFSLENLLHIGPISIYDKGKKAVVNLCVEDKNMKHLLKLSTADIEGKNLTNFIPLPFNGTDYSVAHPAINESGDKLFFVSDMPGGIGGTDIYMSELKAGKWTAAKNLGRNINTAGDEKYPFYSMDNVLFFTSDGRYGMGGMDIYYVDLQFKDSIVVNMGYPINSSMDDFGFSYDPGHKTGYFSSNRKSKGKEDDIYEYTENKIVLEVSFFDDFNENTLQDFNVELRDNELNIPIRSNKGINPNIINALLRPDHEYKMTINKEDYEKETFIISTYSLNNYSETIFKKISLKRKSIYFASLKLKNEPAVENFSKALIVVNNLTHLKMDTLEHQGPSATIKLDGNCEYIITSRDGDKLRYIYVEKKPIVITDKLPYYNLYLTSARPSVLHMKIKKCALQNQSSTDDLRIKVIDWVNANDFYITPGPEGDFKIIVTDSRLYEILLNEKKIPHTGKQVQLGGYCITYPDN